MLRSSSKTKMFGALVSFASLSLLCASSALATTATRNTNFQVNVGDALLVSVTTPDAWATGNVNQFLRNHIVVTATTNAAGGVTAAMYTKTANTDLVNTRSSSYLIHTLSGSISKNNFPVNRWGYSTNDSESSPDSDGSVDYDPMSGPSNPILLISESNPGGPYTQDVFFGAKADSTIASGTYASTVVISVVTGVIDENETTNGEPNPDYNPIVPVNPSTDNPTPNTPTYNPTTNQTTYTTVVPNTEDDTTTTTTEVATGDVTSSYANPHGVRTSTGAEVSDNSGLATGLAITSAVAGATGFVFFIVGKRRKDEDEEEAGGQQQPPVQQ